MESGSCQYCGKQLPSDANLCLFCGGKRVYDLGIFQSPAPDQNKSMPSELSKKLRFHQDKLLNTGGRSRSVLLRRIVKKSSFDLSKLSELAISQKAVLAALSGKGSIKLISDYDDDEDSDISRNHMVALYRTVKHIEEETGLREFYFGWPFVAGHLTKEDYVRAPLLLFAIDVYHKKDGSTKSGWYIEFRSNERPLINRALLATIAKKTNYSLSEDFSDQLEDLLASLNELKNERSGNSNSLVKTVLNRLADLLNKNGLPIRPAEATGSPKPLSDLSSEQLEQMPEQKLYLEDHRVIGIFQQGSAAIYNDYTELFEKAESGQANQGIIDNLLDVPSPGDIPDREVDDNSVGHSNSEDIVLDSIPDDEFNTVKPSDASQDRILLTSKMKECTVVRGPPGTGKSQLIVNMISDGLRRGKKVLLVCQKRAALDVVYKRLGDVGLDDYVVLLHNAQSDRPEMYSKLAALLEERESGIESRLQKASNQLLQISKEIDQNIGEILSLTKPLWQEYYSSQVGDETYGGITLHRLYSSIPSKYQPQVHFPYEITSTFNYQSLRGFLDRIPALEPLCKRFDTVSHPWHTRKDFSALGMKERDKIRDLLNSSMSILDSQKIIVCSDVAQYDDYISSIDGINGAKDEFIQDLKNYRSTFSQSLLEMAAFSGKISEKSIGTLRSIEQFLQAPDEMVFKVAWGYNNDYLQTMRSKLSDVISELEEFEKNRFNSLCSSIGKVLPSKDVIVIVTDNSQNATLENYIIGSSNVPGLAERPLMGNNLASAAGLMCCSVDLASIEANPNSIKNMLSSGFAASGNSAYLKDMRTAIFELVAQKAEAGDKEAKKALKIDGFLSRMKGVSPHERAVEIADNKSPCDNAALDSFLRREFQGSMKEALDFFLFRQEGNSKYHNGSTLPKSVADVFALFATINEMFLGKRNLYILKNLTSDGVAVKIAAELVSKQRTHKTILLSSPQFYQSLVDSRNELLGALTATRAEIIIEQRVQKYIDTLWQLVTLIDSYLAKMNLPQRLTLLSFLSRRGILSPSNSELAKPIEIRNQLQTGRELLVNLIGLENFLQSPLEYFENSLSALKTKLEALSKGLDDFDLIQELDRQKARLSSIQKQVIKLCSEKIAHLDNWAEIIKNDFFYNWIMEIEDRYPDLKGSPFERYTQLRNQLSDLVERKRAFLAKKLVLQMQSNAMEIERAFSRARSYSYRYSSNQSQKDLNRFIFELSKKRKVKPVRKLVDEYSSIIFKVAPCWLASPEVVSEVFPLQRKLFDIIIVDEASQCAVERMLPALYRGDKIVIVGDDKQLRPFDLFRLKDDEKGYDDATAEDDTLVSESLLTLAKRTYGEDYLTWHYRSKYQELIDFSNHAFYNGYLRVAPSLHSKPDDPPIKWIPCKGLWDKRANIEEAVKVVDEIKAIWQKSGKSRSIGVVTFNDEQRDVILNEIERRKQNDPEFESLYYENSGESERHESEEELEADLQRRKTVRSKANTQSKIDEQNEKLFVKNIENVQGDERDIIIFSIGYAPDKEGKLQQHFGTLSIEGGENRLNVAITRARQEVRIVCSLDPEDLKETTKNPGPRLLKKYLIYAKAISENNKQVAESILEELNPGFVRKKRDSVEKVVVTESILEEQVYNALVSKGYKVDTQVGYSGYRIDLALAHPDDPSRYILAIECDGETFHSAKSVRERDIARQKFLEHMGWDIERIWSRNWWRNSDRELQRIEQKIEELRSNPGKRIRPN